MKLIMNLDIINENNTSGYLSLAPCSYCWVMVTSIINKTYKLLWWGNVYSACLNQIWHKMMWSEMLYICIYNCFLCYLTTVILKIRNYSLFLTVLKLWPKMYVAADQVVVSCSGVYLKPHISPYTALLYLRKETQFHIYYC